jgi:4-amino-4-deoxy-L-arabinose transferase-like glycosyltransferase
VFAVMAVAVVRSARTVGIAWAENDYFEHLDAIVGWARRTWALGPGHATDLVGPYWENGRYFNPHPPLYKYLALLTRWALPGLGWPLAERAATAIVFAGAVAGLFAALARWYGIAAGLVAAAAMATMPRVFGHAMFCSPDVPVAAAWLGAALSWERFDDTRRRAWLLLTGVFLAAGVATKISAILLILPLGTLTLIWRWRAGGRDVVWGAFELAGIALASIVTLVVLYPFLWPDPAGRFAQLILQAAGWSQANPFSAMFLGRMVRYPELPWYFGPTIVFLTTPPLTLALASWGIVSGLRRPDRPWQVAVVLVAFWFLLVAVPSTPKYDNERQLLPLFVFLAALAGIGWHALASLVARRKFGNEAVIAGTAVVVLVLAGGLVRAHPFPLRYFTPLVGGPEGAVALGFEPTYLMEVLSPAVLADFQERIPAGAGVTVLPGTSVGRILQRRGFLRPDLRLNDTSGPYWILADRHNVLLEFPGAAVRAHGVLLDEYRLDGVTLAELRYLEGVGG